MNMSGTTSVGPNTAFTLSERLSAEARVPASDRLHEPGHRIPWLDFDKVTRWVGIGGCAAFACSEAASPPRSSLTRAFMRRGPPGRSFNPGVKALIAEFVGTPD